MPGPTGFRLDDEQRKQVHDCLRKAGAGLVELSKEDDPSPALVRVRL